MKITSKNYPEIGQSIFYKATQSGVQICHIVKSWLKTSNYSESPLDWGPTIEEVSGYVSDSLFTRIRQTAIGIPFPSDVSHFDQPNSGYFTTEQEAIELHRELVLNYIKGLNASSLKTCPIVTG